MAELADALASGASRGNPVEVQVLLSALYLSIETYQGDCYDYYQVLSSFNIYKKLKELDSYLT